MRVFAWRVQTNRALGASTWEQDARKRRTYEFVEPSSLVGGRNFQALGLGGRDGRGDEIPPGGLCGRVDAQRGRARGSDAAGAGGVWRNCFGQGRVPRSAG